MSLPSAENRFGAFRHSSYRRFFSARFFSAFAIQIVSVSVGWQMYEVTGNAFYLGLIGLFQFLPSLLLILVTGTVADRHNRRRIMAVCLVVAAGCAAALLGLTLTHSFSPWPVFAILVVFGIERAFMGPAVQSLAPNLVPVEDLASILGPVAGGLLYGLGASVAYIVAFMLFIVSATLAVTIRKPEQRGPAKAISLETMLAGFKFISQEKIVLGAISLDLFAVLLGGAVALMPIFAKEVLTLGPWGLGLLRAAPGIGAITVAVILAFRPIRHHAGLLMFIGVGLFGISTVVFGLSETAWVSIAALVVMGASDMVSVYVRETLIALWTPDEVRGRVNAVNMVFVGASNELGEFRAGTMAHVVGAVPAVVIGGAGTLAVAVIWALGFSKLRKIDNLDAPR